MNITTSPDISTLDFELIFDLRLSRIIIVNRSEGASLGNLKTFFAVKTPSDTVVMEGTKEVPQFINLWDTLVVNLPLVNGHLEWGGKGYSVAVSVMDSGGRVFTKTKARPICRPNGYKDAQKDNYGVMNIDMTILCDTARLLVQEKTDYIYNKLIGIEVSRDLRLVYPSISATRTYNPFTKNGSWGVVQIPLLVNGKGHNLLAECVMRYDFGDRIYVEVPYRYSKIFTVNCHVDLCAVYASIAAYEKELQENGCYVDSTSKLLQLYSLASKLLAAKMQPDCCMDVTGMLKKIEDITCRPLACSKDLGVHPLANSGLVVTDPLTVFNTLLNSLDPKCLASSKSVWENYTIAQKLQTLINKTCDPGCPAPVLTSLV